MYPYFSPRVLLISDSSHCLADFRGSAVWDDESAKWWFCAVDIAEALTKSKNPRNYWAKFKSRHNELLTICHQLKLKAKDGKFYYTDVVDETGLNTVIAVLPSKKADIFTKWMKNMETSLDEKSKQPPYGYEDCRTVRRAVCLLPPFLIFIFQFEELENTSTPHS